MRIAFIGGSHPRHLYYMSHISKRFNVAGFLLQRRGEMEPMPPDGISDYDKHLWVLHFANRAKKEKEYFKDAPSEIPPAWKKITLDDVNDDGGRQFIRSLNADLTLIFGCGMIRQSLYKELPKPAINLHLGISPRYRGSATLFWPFYFLEPNWAGCTFHKIVDEPDAGDILHQCRPMLFDGDTIHDVGARAVIAATYVMVGLLENLENGKPWKFKKQKNTGKCFLTTDFQPAHLRLIYQVFEDKIVDYYLSGKIRPKTQPRLYERNLLWD